MNGFIYQHPMFIILSLIPVCFNVVFPLQMNEGCVGGATWISCPKKHNQLAPCFQALSLSCLYPGSQTPVSTEVLLHIYYELLLSSLYLPFNTSCSQLLSVFQKCIYFSPFLLFNPVPWFTLLLWVYTLRLSFISITEE